MNYFWVFKLSVAPPLLSRVFVPPEEFDAIADLARTLGFRKVVAGPFVRSSYHADEMVPEDAHADHPA
jgi:lipoate synthase